MVTVPIINLTMVNVHWNCGENPQRNIPLVLIDSAAGRFVAVRQPQIFPAGRPSCRLPRGRFRQLPLAFCGALAYTNLKATPHNYVCGALRKFCPLILLRFLAIHQVLLQKRAASGGKIFSQIALAKLCGIALKISGRCGTIKTNRETPAAGLCRDKPP